MSGHGDAQPMISHPVTGLSGMAEVPGDKSISHRALILGALSVGETRISGLLEGQDVLDTGRAMRRRWPGTAMARGRCMAWVSAGSPSLTGSLIAAIPALACG